MVWSWCTAAPEPKAAKTKLQHLSPCAPTTAQADTNRTEFYVITTDLSFRVVDRTIWQLFSVYLAMVCLLWITRFKTTAAGAASEVWHAA